MIGRRFVILLAGVLFLAGCPSSRYYTRIDGVLVSSQGDRAFVSFSRWHRYREAVPKSDTSDDRDIMSSSWVVEVDLATGRSQRRATSASAVAWDPDKQILWITRDHGFRGLGHEGEIQVPATIRDGSRLVLGGTALLAYTEGRIELWDMRSSKLATVTMPRIASGFRENLSPDEPLLVISDIDGRDLRYIEVDLAGLRDSELSRVDQTSIPIFFDEAAGEGVADWTLSPNVRYAAVIIADRGGTRARRLVVLDLRSGETVPVNISPEETVADAAFADDEYLVLAHARLIRQQERSISIVALDTGRTITHSTGALCCTALMRLPGTDIVHASAEPRGLGAAPASPVSYRHFLVDAARDKVAPIGPPDADWLTFHTGRPFVRVGHSLYDFAPGRRLRLIDVDTLEAHLLATPPTVTEIAPANDAEGRLILVGAEDDGFVLELYDPQQEASARTVHVRGKDL